MSEDEAEGEGGASGDGAGDGKGACSHSTAADRSNDGTLKGYGSLCAADCALCFKLYSCSQRAADICMSQPLYMNNKQLQAHGHCDTCAFGEYRGAGEAVCKAASGQIPTQDFYKVCPCWPLAGMLLCVDARL